MADTDQVRAIREYYIDDDSNGTEPSIYHIWEKGGGRGNVTTPATSSPPYRDWIARPAARPARRAVPSRECSAWAAETAWWRRFHRRRHPGARGGRDATGGRTGQGRGLDAVCADVLDWTPPAEPWTMLYADGSLGHLYDPDTGLRHVLSRFRSWLPEGSLLVLSNDPPWTGDAEVQQHPDLAYWFLSQSYLERRSPRPGSPTSAARCSPSSSRRPGRATGSWSSPRPPSRDSHRPVPLWQDGPVPQQLATAEDLVTRLRQDGLARGGFLALSVAPDRGLAVAAPSGARWALADSPPGGGGGPAGGGVPAALGVVVPGHPGRAGRAPASGWPPAGTWPRCTGCCSAAGAADPGADLGRAARPGPDRCRAPASSTCSAAAATRAPTPRTRCVRTGTCARSGPAAAGPATRSGWPRWAGTALAAPALQQRRLAARPAAGDAAATARSESAAELLCAELAVDGLPIDLDRGRADHRLVHRPPAARRRRGRRGCGSAGTRRCCGWSPHCRRASTCATRPRCAPCWPGSASTCRTPGPGGWSRSRGAHPVIEALLAWRKAERIATTYGYDWLDRNVGPDGRLRGAWTGSDGAAGRMTAQAGLHNLPADLRPAVARRAGPRAGPRRPGPDRAAGAGRRVR